MCRTIHPHPGRSPIFDLSITGHINITIDKLIKRKQIDEILISTDPGNWNGANSMSPKEHGKYLLFGRTGRAGCSSKKKDYDNGWFGGSCGNCLAEDGSEDEDYMTKDYFFLY